MALTIAAVASEPGPVYSLGDLKAVIVDITWDSSYATAGETLAASTLGLSHVVFAVCEPALKSDTTACIFPFYDRVNGKLQAFWGNAGAASVVPEVTSTTDLSAYTGRCIFFGK